MFCIFRTCSRSVARILNVAGGGSEGGWGWERGCVGPLKRLRLELLEVSLCRATTQRKTLTVVVLVKLLVMEFYPLFQSKWLQLSFGLFVPVPDGPLV